MYLIIINRFLISKKRGRHGDIEEIDVHMSLKASLSYDIPLSNCSLTNYCIHFLKISWVFLAMLERAKFPLQISLRCQFMVYSYKFLLVATKPHSFKSSTSADESQRDFLPMFLHKVIVRAKKTTSIRRYTTSMWPKVAEPEGPPEHKARNIFKKLQKVAI